MNSVTLIGRLTREPELRHTPSGVSVCELRVAVDRAGPKTDEDKNGPGFFDVIVWDAAAETCAQYLEKGQQVGVKGRLQWREWEGTDGTKRQKVEIVADKYFGVDFLAKAGEGRGDRDSQDELAPVGSVTGGGMLAPDEDIPF